MSQGNHSDKQSRRTVVEEGTHFKGDLVSSCPIDVRGRVEGEVQAPSLTVSASGAVHGRARLGSVHSEGELSGEFEADTIVLSGTVKDKTVIRARSLEVKLASTKGQQVVFGDCELSVGDEPGDADAVEAPASAPVASLRPALDAELSADSTQAEDDTDSEQAGADASGQSEQPEAGESAEVAGNIAEALASEASSGETDEQERKPNGGEVTSGWSQPPSQPPPAE